MRPGIAVLPYEILDPVSLNAKKQLSFNFPMF